MFSTYIDSKAAQALVAGEAQTLVSNWSGLKVPGPTCPYSEAERLSKSRRRNTAAQDKIDQLLRIGHFGNPPRGASRFKRPPKPRGHWRKESARILTELVYDRVDDVFPFYNHLPKLDPRLEWALDLLVNRFYCEGWSFLTAIVKDAGVWPPPKWWRVHRRLMNSTRPTR